MLPDRVSNPGPLTYESGALPIALRGPARRKLKANCSFTRRYTYTHTIRLSYQTSRSHLEEVVSPKLLKLLSRLD